MVSLRISIVFFFALGTYIVANQINDRVLSKTDKYLPKKFGKLNGFFWFYKKGQPVRWLAYWIERITQILMFIYIISLVFGNLITDSWDFVTINFVGYWGAILFLYPFFFEIVVDIYVFFRDILEKHKK